MNYEKPAEGIMKTGEFGPSKHYFIQCQCGSIECAHDVEVEADDCDIQVHIYYTCRTKWWDKNRWKQIWEILTKGYTEMQATLVINEQTALNYSETLKSAMNDVKEFKQNRMSSK